MQAKAEELVTTPMGMRPKSHVHAILPYQSVKQFGNRFEIADSETGVTRSISRNAENPRIANWVENWWISFASWLAPENSGITSFSTKWIVPETPSLQQRQTLFYFNGIEPNDQHQAILQPVLQWGFSAAGGGDYWGIANWYVGTGEAFHSPVIQVQSGQVLTGIMKLTGQSNGKYNYVSTFDGYPEADLTMNQLAELKWYVEVLEAYNVSDCAEFPTGKVAFDGINLATQEGASALGLTWTPTNLATDCGQHAVVVDNSTTNGEVDVYYAQ